MCVFFAILGADFVFIDNYQTNLNPVLGQMLNIRYRVAISGGVIMSPPVLLFNQISPINGESLVQNTENAQLYEVMIDVVTDMNNGAYTLRLFVFERMEMLNTNITVASECSYIYTCSNTQCLLLYKYLQ